MKSSVVRLCRSIVVSMLMAISPSAIAAPAQAEPGVQMKFQASEPCGLLRFMDSLAEQDGEGPALGLYFRSQRQLDADDLAQIQTYKDLSSAAGSQLLFDTPSGRKQGLKKHLKTTACEFQDFYQFYEKAREYCTPTYFRDLRNILTHFRPLYEEQIWLPCLPVLKSDIQWFEANESKFGSPLGQVSQLFLSSPKSGRVITANLVPVPYMVTGQGKHMHIKAEPSDSEGLEPNYICASVNILSPKTVARLNDPWLTGEAESLNKCTLIGNEVLFHESVHLLWASRNERLKAPLYDSFSHADMIFNYDILNESQASALTAWFHKKVSGKENENDWYDNKYVSSYARALLPVLEEYIDSNKFLDENYANKAMKAFEKTFIDWRDDPQIVLWRSQIVTAQGQESVAEGLSGRIYRFGSGDHQLRVVKGETWEARKREFLKEPKINTIFFLRPSQLDLLQEHFEVPAKIVQKLKEQRIACVNTGQR